MSDSKNHQKDALSPISLKEILGYAVGDAGFNFYWIIIGSYLSYFYTDIFGMSAAAAGTMFLVTKIIDAFTDPAMGAIADRTNSRWGKFRPYLLFGAIPMAAAAILTMSTPDLGDTGKIVWAYATYTMMMLCYTILSTPYSSLAGVVTANADERNKIFGWRFFFAYTTGIIVGAFTPGLADYFANGSEAHGWQMTMVLYASVATVLFLITFATTKERIQPPKGQVTKPLDDIKDLLNNKPWIILFALAMIIMMTIVFRGSSATYYFKYFVQRPDLMGAFIGVQMAAYAVGCLLSPYLTKLMDKAKLLMVLMTLVGVFSIAFAFIPKPQSTGVVTVDNSTKIELHAKDLLDDIDQNSNRFQWVEHKAGIFWFLKDLDPIGDNTSSLILEPVTSEAKANRVISVYQMDENGAVIQDSSDLPKEIIWMFILNIIISLALGPKSPITWSMYADAADFNQWKTGRRATAMTFSAATFSQKLGGALGSAGILWVLASLGYSANQIQEGASLSGIVWLQTVVPAFFAFVAIFALKFYDLSEAKLKQIQQDLSERNS
ncbi:MFS transporter [Lutimonas saemankumensis]|uniref:MFS transporter n=1 Tax=Lutimonas saemankumensis TaxID=483016 RepID=UPI001CD51FC2|nr:MFS transporter [Lutimonas saemankumensis]MCA0931850.1 MFS transporter [Lutimonas saemankumensis]